MNEMYSDYRVVSDRAVDTHVKNLRRKLGSVGYSEVVLTVYGFGYRLAESRWRPQATSSE